MIATALLALIVGQSGWATLLDPDGRQRPIAIRSTQETIQ